MNDRNVRLSSAALLHFVFGQGQCPRCCIHAHDLIAFSSNEALAKIDLDRQ